MAGVLHRRPTRGSEERSEEVIRSGDVTSISLASLRHTFQHAHTTPHPPIRLFETERKESTKKIDMSQVF